LPDIRFGEALDALGEQKRCWSPRVACRAATPDVVERGE
jgi:hypothetical protein